MKKIWLLSLVLPVLLIPACSKTEELPPPEPSEDIAGPPPEGEDDGTSGANTQ